MKNLLKKQILSLKNLPHVSKKEINQLLKRIDQGNLIKSQNPADHFCVFFLPVHKQSKSIYLGHHIKADDWIAPGGHIELDENPIDSIKREFFEELGHKLTNEPIEFFDISSTPINNPRYFCKMHRDLWHFVLTDRIDFRFDKKEFYDAGWFGLKQSLQMIKQEQYNKIIRKLAYYL